MERRRKNVVRLSEVMGHQIEENGEEEKENHTVQAPFRSPPELVDPLVLIAPASDSLKETLLLQNKEQVYSSSPIVIQNRNKTAITDDDTTTWSNDKDEEEEDEEYSTFGSMNSLTKVSRFVHTTRPHTDTTIFNENQDDKEERETNSQILTEAQCLDLILFDGLKIKSPPPKTKSATTGGSNNNSKETIDLSCLQPKRRLLLDKTNINRNLKVISCFF